MPVSFVTAVFAFGVVVGELVIIGAQKLGRCRAERMRWRYAPLSRPAGAAGSQAWPTGLLRRVYWVASGQHPSQHRRRGGADS